MPTARSKLKEKLDAEVKKRNHADELSALRADPLMVARRYKDEYIALVCALFAYGNAKKIVAFLESLDFSLLDQEEKEIRQKCEGLYYRFQNTRDVSELFITLSRLKKEQTLEDLFLKGYRKNRNVLEGVFTVLDAMKAVNSYESQGYLFLSGTKHSKGAYKRWMMFLRWMVRRDHLDMGLWHHVSAADLLLPLDTHTFKVGQKLGLLKRKSYDLKAVYEITEALRALDPQDPVKYDFALYRLGQEKLL